MELNREIVRLRYEYQGGVGNEITRMLTNNGSGNNNYKLYRSFIVEGGDTTQYREDNNNIRQREIDGETKARGETREIFVYEHKGTGITNSGDGAGEVYIVAHGWNPDFTDFLEIANHVKTAKPAATVLVIDWMQAAQTRNTNPGFNSSAPNFKAVTWIGAIAQEFKAKLQKDFSPQSINFIGHSFGTFVSSETAGLLGGVNTITALDPASRTGTGGYDLYPNKLSRYDLYPDISGRQGPRNFKDVTNYSRAYVGSLSIAGNQALAATAHESFQMNFGLGFRPPGSEHGWVVKTAKTFIDPDHPRKLAENPFSSEEEKPILFSLDDNQFHPQFALDVPGLKGTNLLTQESYVHQGVMVVNQPNEVQFLVAAKTDLTGTLVFGTNQDDDLSPSNEISKDLLLRIGNNTYYADEGDDKIESDAGNDTLYGGEGNDTLDGYIGDDELYGGKGNDSLVGSFGNDGLNGGEGNDTLNGSVGNDDLLGGIGNDSLVGSFGDDALFGDEGNDTLKGSDGDDLLAGGAGDDTLDGGAGRDTAFFSDLFENYDYTFSRNLNPFVRDTITFAHNRGTLADGTDTLKGMDFGQFFGVTLDGETRNYIARLPLEDGPEDNNEISFLNNNGNSIYASLGSSIYMLDGDADYKINLSSSPQNLQYNIAYIIDVSGSMDGTPLQEAKSAYTSLTNSLINSGIADVSQFKVIPFDDGVYPSAVVDANEAISTIQGLSSGGFTYFAPALYTAYNFFDGLPEGGTNIAYFLSDGEASDSFNSKASLLKSLADVQAYGIGDGVDTDQLRIVDSDGNISVLQDPSDLTDEFNNSDFSADSIAKIDLLLDGAVVDTIQSSELIEDALGLSFEGSIDDLDVSFGAENLLTAEIFFTDGTPTSTVDFTIASGLEEVTDDNPFDEIVNGTSGDDTIRLGSIDLGSNSGAGDDKVVGNDLDNIIDSGSGNDIVFGNDGNDTITTGSGQDRIDGGDGMDTVVYTNQFFANSSIQKVGNVITVDNTDTLTNVEFIQFSDVRISTHNLQPIPLLTTSDIVIAEGNSSNTNAQFTFNLSLAPTEDVQFTYSTQDMTAVAGEDYIAKTGQVTIAAGETSATVEVEIVADTVSESEELFVLNLSDVSGAYFENDEPEYNVFATIEQVNILYGDTENNFLEGVSGKNFIDGQEGDDILIGSADDDTLAGGAGNDTLEGSTGNDTYVIDSLNDTIIENASSGNDTVETSINYSLKNVSNVENLTLIGDAIDGIGNSDNNRITGNAKDNTLNGEEGNDTLTGGAGNDTLLGGEGDDTYIVDSLDDTIVENYSSSDVDTVKSSVDYSLAQLNNLENLILTGSAINGTGNSRHNQLIGNAQDNILDGGSLNDTLNGNAGNDSLIGGDGRDTLDGGTGNDTLIGGAENDFYIVDSPDDIIVEYSGFETNGGGWDKVEASVDYSLENFAHVEDLILIGNAIQGTGNSKHNRITGNSFNNLLNGGEGNDNLYGGEGNDTLNGGVGWDTLDGGAGDDTYIIEYSWGNSIIENPDSGIDTIKASMNYSLRSNFENLILTGNALEGTGNDSDNQITGNALDNKLNGSVGKDTLYGGAGNDTLDGGSGNLNADDVLVGGDGNDILYGKLGNDTLIGGMGNDKLVGSYGADIFVFNNPNEGTDEITDFSVIDDTIHISAAGFGGGLTAGNAISEDQILIGTSPVAADNTTQRFIYNTNSGALFFDADGNQTGFDAVQIATLSNEPTISANDIFVTV